MSTFLSGMIIGFSIAAPVGPIGVLCIRRTLADGRLHGLASGLGAASADAIYGSIGAVIILMMWLYLSVWAVLLGGAINAELDARMQGWRAARR